MSVLRSRDPRVQTLRFFKAELKGMSEAVCSRSVLLLNSRTAEMGEMGSR